MTEVYLGNVSKVKDNLKDEAIKYLDLGFFVLPGIPGQKRPCGPWAHRRNIKPDIDEINGNPKWNNPHTQILCATGELSGVVVIDIDVKDGKNGFQTLGEIGLPLPLTPTADSPSGGAHFYYRWPRYRCSLSVGLLGKDSGVDLIADNNIIVLPPSIHHLGGQYKWREGLSPWDVPFAELPGWALERLSRLHVVKRRPVFDVKIGDELASVFREDVNAWVQEEVEAVDTERLYHSIGLEIHLERNIDINEFFASFVPRYKPRGNLKCPLHTATGENPSLSIDRHTGFWKCHSTYCGRSGNIFNFYREIWAMQDVYMTHEQAVRSLYKIVKEGGANG